MKFAIPTIAALVLAAATASAQQPDPLPLVPPTVVAPVVVSPPPVVVTRPPVVVVAPPVVIARPGVTIGIGAPYPIYRPYYAPPHYYHHRHW